MQQKFEFRASHPQPLYLIIILLALLSAPFGAVAKFSAVLEGQSKNSPDWIANNLQGWHDCDYIPMRVYVTGGAASNEAIRVYFAHFSGTRPGVEDLSSFTPSANVIITAGPVLEAPDASGTWFYDFTISLTNKSPGWVEFRGRLAAGAHLNPGASLHLGGTPSLSTLQIFKPGASPGTPDLAIIKHGLAQARPGMVMTYTVNYTNKASCLSDATTVQLSDMLPPSVSYVAGSSHPNATIVGNSLFWDLDTVPRGTGGMVSYQVRVSATAPNGLVFNNYAQIFSSEDDANYGDNVSEVITTVVFNRPPNASNDAYSIVEDGRLAITPPGLLANDSDPDGDPLTAVLMSGPAHGTLSLAADGGFTYVPAANFNGSDSFAYRANDGRTNSLPATVAITVGAVNDRPSFTKGPNQLVNEDAGPQTILNWATNISAGPADESNQTVMFIVSNDTNALFSAQPAISPSGGLTYTPAPHAYGVAHVTATLKDSGGTANGGVDTSVPQTFTLTVNAPPSVNIVKPTNATIFIAPANITLLVEAHDLDGTITQVQIRQGTNVLFQTNSAPALTLWTNVPAGNYQFTARATDNAGASTTSNPVNVTVVDHLPLLVIEPPHFNPQTGLFEELVRILNPTPINLAGARVFVRDLAAGMQVFNASGQMDGATFVQSKMPIVSGGSVELTIEYYVPNYQTPNPTLTAGATDPLLQSASTDFTLVPATRELRMSNGEFLVEFKSLTNRVYFLQYSRDLKSWQTAWPSVTGAGDQVQWIDNGPPRTESAPGVQPCRFYRVLLAP